MRELTLNDIARVIRFGIAETLNNGGCTVVPEECRTADIPQGYLYGIHSLLQIPVDQCHDSRLVLSYASLVYRDRDQLECGDRYVGFWLDTDTGTVHIDVVEYSASLVDAIAEAVDNGELAIWDCGQNCGIRLSDISPIRPNDQSKNGKGIRTVNGVQPWSVGDHYPLIVSSRGQGSSGEWYIWNGSTGQILQRYAFGNSLQWCADVTEDDARRRAYRDANRIAALLRTGSEVE